MSDEFAMCLDHVSLNVGDLEVAKSFYGTALAPLGLSLVMDVTPEMSGTIAFSGFGRGRKGFFWLAAGGRQTPTVHVCFRAGSRQAVRDFHAAALSVGGLDNGEPGLRNHYHPSYFAAFVLDPEGHNIEAVCYEPEAPA